MSGESITGPFTQAPAAPAPTAAPARMSADSFEAHIAAIRSGTQQNAIVAQSSTEAAPIQHATTTAPMAQQEHVAETMTQEEVAGLEQHWAALRTAIKPEELPELARAIQANELPARMQSAMVRFTHGGQEVAMPVHELVRGNMRLRDYSRRMNEVKQQQEANDRLVANLQNLFNSWGNPESMLQSMKRLGKFEQFEKAAIHLAKIRIEEERMTPAQKEARRLQEQLAERERQFAERIAALEARERQGQQTAKTDIIAKQLHAWTPAAFQRHGIPDFPAAASWFQANLESIWHFGELTPQLVDDAAALTAEQYRMAVQQHEAGQRQAAAAAPQGGPRPLPVQAVAGNAGAIPAQATRRRLSEFDDVIRGRR